MFVNLKMLGKMARSVAPENQARMHPLLKVARLTTATKAAYVNGCVLASIVCTGEPTEMGRKTVYRIAQSLKTSKADVDEAFLIATGLVSDREKQNFVEETLAILKDATVSRYFMSDFKNILAFTAPIAGEVLELYNYIGMILFETEDWRENMSEGWREEKRKKKHFKQQQQETEEYDSEGEEKNPPEWWDPLPVREKGEIGSHFYTRVKDMVERRKRYAHEKFRCHEINVSLAQEMMEEADRVLDDVKQDTYRERAEAKAKAEGREIFWCYEE